MSEVLEQAPPLAPETETPGAGETAPEPSEPVENKAPEAPEWSKPVQKVQERTANMEKKIDRLTEAVEALASQPQTVETKDELAELMEQAKGFDPLVPGISEHLGKIVNAVRAETRAARAEAREARESIDSQGDFEAFISRVAELVPGKQEEFRRDYIKAQREIMDDAKSNGEKVKSTDLKYALGFFTRQWIKEQKTAPAPAPTRSATVRGFGSSGGKPRDDLEILRSGHYVDTKGNVVQGNVLGI